MNSLDNRTTPFLVVCLMAIMLSLGSELQAQPNVTPAQYLALQPKPNFAPGHHLPHLTRFAWPLSSNLNIELATNWGYTLDLGDATTNLLARITKTNTMESQFLFLATNFPNHYALSANINRTFPTPIPDDFYVTNAQGLFVDDYSNSWQSATNTKYTKIVSPEAPDSYWAQYAEFAVSPLRAIQSNAPIAIVLNGGEYGLGVSGFDIKAWQFDPRVIAVRASNQISLNRYISHQKAQQLSFLTTSLRAALPSRELYIFYNTGNEQNRFVVHGYGDWEDGWANWGWASDAMNADTDLPSFESYYVNGNSWTNRPGAGWSQVTDLLTKHLNAVGYNINLGNSLNYSWVCGGWGTNPNSLADINRYIGFLKCLYTSGMNGAVAGYFGYPSGGFDASFPTNAPPHWLLQIQALANVHALFSKLETFLFNGDLLPGPNPHFMSADQPAYEFPTGDAFARVLVRKLRNDDQWLITAWAAAGDDRNINVTIPNLGTVQVLARGAGSVYQATKTNLTLVDINGIFPSELGPPSNLKLIPAAGN